MVYLTRMMTDDDVPMMTKRMALREKAEMRKSCRMTIAAVMMMMMKGQAEEAGSSSLEVADAPGGTVEEYCRLPSW